MSNNETAAVKAIGSREYHYLENKLSGMVVTQSKQGAVVVAIVDVRDGKPFRDRVRRIEKASNSQRGSKYFADGDAKKFHARSKMTAPKAL